MRRLEAEPLIGFNDIEIDLPATFSIDLNGQDLSYETLITNTPAVTSTYDGYNEPQLVIGTDYDLPLWDDSAYYPVGRLAHFHGRNLEVLAEDVTIADQYGNEYSSLCIKGCDFSNPYFYKSITAQREFIVHGLQESLVMERVLRTSKLLRENGVGTEYIIGLVQPERYPWGWSSTEGIDDRFMRPLEDFRTGLALMYGFSTEDNQDEPEKAIEISNEMVKKFQDCDYLISYRAMDCPYRFGEFRSGVDDEGNYQEGNFENFVSFLNENFLDPKDLSYIENIDIYSYTEKIFSYNFALNLGKTHKLGIIHKFLHPNNITAMGSLVDLDSCRGAKLGLGDSEPTKQEYLADVISGIQSIYHVLSSMDYSDISLTEKEKLLDTDYRSTITFLDTYVNERFESIHKKAEFLAELLVAINQSIDYFREPFKRIQLSQAICTTYLIQDNREDTLETISKDYLNLNFTPKTRHSSAFLYALPPTYFKKIESRFMDESWSVNEEVMREGEQSNRRIVHPVYASLKAMMLELTTLQFRGENAEEIINSAGLLYTFSCAHEWLSKEVDTTDPTYQDVVQYQHQQKQTVLDHFKRYRDDPYNNSDKEESRENCGGINLARPEELETKWHEVIYLEYEEQYSVFIDIVKENNYKIKKANNKDIECIRDAKSSLYMIADHNDIESLSQNTSSTMMNTNLFNGARRRGVKPLIVVDPSTDGGIVYVLSTMDSHGANPEYYSLEQLSSLLCLSNTQPIKPTLDLSLAA